MTQPPSTSPLPISIIAEAGVNHNGQIEMAMQLIDAAADAGADTIKFQTFRTEELVSRHAAKAVYQQALTDPEESQFEMIKKLELDQPTHLLLKKQCRQRGINFLSTPFDLTSLDFLVDVMKLSTIKIPSGEITNTPLLVRVGATNRRIILSTGMSSLGETEAALGALAFGMLRGHETPSLTEFSRAFSSQAGQAALAEKVILLHCTTEYPTPFNDVNLRAMETLKQAFGLPVGLSDHTQGLIIPIAAAALGARVIEKHFTLDRTLPGPDHKASLEPDELSQMVQAIRNVELALGHGRKISAESENKNKTVARKSLIALTDIKQGEIFTKENLGVKRPGTGISPMNYWHWLGRPAQKEYQPDECITQDNPQ